jgi:hypothetical protein
MSSYYKTIDGVDYDKKILDIACDRIQGRGDGRISVEDVKEIAKAIKDKNKITKTEYLTLFYIIKNFNLTTQAYDTLAEELSIL